MVFKNKTKMSLSHTVFEAVDNTVKKFCKKTAEQYNLDEKELYSLWCGEKQINDITITNIETNNITTTSQGSSELMKLQKKELVELCKAKSLKCTGTKAELVSRLSGSIQTENKSQIKKDPLGGRVATTKKVENQPPVIKNLISDIPVVSIRRNNFGRYEHPETSLLLDQKTKKVYGKQNQNGNVDDLTSEDIENCKKFKFEYTLPENLDKKVKLSEIEIEDLEEGVEEKKENSTEGAEEKEDDEEDDEEEDEEEEFEEEVLLEEEEFEEEYDEEEEEEEEEEEYEEDEEEEYED